VKDANLREGRRYCNVFRSTATRDGSTVSTVEGGGRRRSTRPLECWLGDKNTCSASRARCPMCGRSCAPSRAPTHSSRCEETLSPRVVVHVLPLERAGYGVGSLAGMPTYSTMSSTWREGEASSRRPPLPAAAACPPAALAVSRCASVCGGPSAVQLLLSGRAPAHSMSEHRGEGKGGVRDDE